ncbi:MAG: Uma2 family endonuclease [Isosphaeraceae bacterium]|nr:Uma2 family endonuclease [Isosphaeraceae bacterium]
MPPGPVRRFTVAEYHKMIDAGVFGDDTRFELLEGWIITKMTRKPPHDVALALAHTALGRRAPVGWHIREQSAITTADSEPEPDLAVVRGEPRDYIDHHPSPGEIGLVVEVADTTLAQDRGLKRRIYARAGIPVYWIINLADAVVEVYTDPTTTPTPPRYLGLQTYRAGDEVPLVLDGREIGQIAAGHLLP